MYLLHVCFPQLVSFGLSNEMMVTFKEENLMVFKHLFLKEYKDQRVDRYAVYTKTDVYDHIYYVIDRVMWSSNGLKRAKSFSLLVRYQCK